MRFAASGFVNVGRSIGAERSRRQRSRRQIRIMAVVASSADVCKVSLKMFAEPASVSVDVCKYKDRHRAIERQPE
jgi:hypothetical protein